MRHRFVALPRDGSNVHLYAEDRTTKVRQVLWGDYLHVVEDMGDGWLRLIWAHRSEDPTKRVSLFIPDEHTSLSRPLEIVFVDVGQGDGAVLITPERDESERVVVIDAGERGNMGEFLDGRFGSYATGFDFHAAVITHPDQDHYLGFGPIFDPDNAIGFDVVYHSGLVERPASDDWAKLGGRTAKDPHTKQRYLTKLPRTDAEIRQLFGDRDAMGSFRFPKVMNAAVRNPRIGSFAMLSTDDGTKEGGRTFMPGFAPSDPHDYTIEVIGPVVELDAAGDRRLRTIGSYGETKNGHSVLLRLAIGDFKILFGGDLNEKAEQFLLSHYAGLDAFPKPGSQAHADMIADASSALRADVLKVCHHGSEKVTDAFLACVNAAAFVISSGDEEGHVHPRPDLLGRLGKLGRGDAPVLLSTELQRSSREQEDRDVVRRIISTAKSLAKDPTDELHAKIKADAEFLGRTNVDVWGTIYVKTDGERLIAAFKKEEPSPNDRWFSFEYAFDANGLLQLVDH